MSTKKCFYQKNIILLGKSSKKSFGGVERVHEAIINEINNSLPIIKVHHFYSVFRFPFQYISLLYKLKFDFKNASIISSGFSALAMIFFPFNKKKIFLCHGFYCYDHTYSKLKISNKLKMSIYNNVLLKAVKIINPKLIAPSEVSSLVNSSLTRKSNIKTIPWGGIIKIKNIKPIDFNQREFDLIYHGRFSSVKFQPKILNFLLENIIKYNNKKDIFNLVLSGKSEKYLIDEIKFEIKRNKKLNNVNMILHKDLKDEDIINILCNSKLFVNFHQWEAFGLSIIEALQCGCKLILPSTTPIISTIKKDSFYRFSNSNLNSKDTANIEFIDEIKNSLYDKEYDTKLMSAYYLNKFSWKNCTEKLLSEFF